MSTFDIPTAPVALSFIIVGAGIGGLTAAIGLSMAGHTVTILERAQRLGEVGAGIQVPPNSTKVLRSLGVWDRIRKVSVVPDLLQLLNWKGEVLMTQELERATQETYGIEYIQIHRAEYHRILVERAEELGVTVHCAVDLSSIDFEANCCHVADGRSFTADVIIGADGVRSQMRGLISATPNVPSPARDTPDMAYRCIIELEEMRKYPELHCLIDNTRWFFFWGEGRHLVCYQVMQSGRLVFNVVVSVEHALPDGVYTVPCDDEQFDQLFPEEKGWDVRPRLIAQLMKGGRSCLWRLQDAPDVDWVHPSSPVALMGDACHATLPYLAQGAAQAVEDSAALTCIFSQAKSKDREYLRSLLLVYEQSRRARSRGVVEGSRVMQYTYHVSGEARAERDRLLAGDGAGDADPNPWRNPAIQSWLFAHDAFDNAEQQMKKFVANYDDGHSMARNANDDSNKKHNGTDVSISSFVAAGAPSPIPRQLADMPQMLRSAVGAADANKAIE